MSYICIFNTKDTHEDANGLNLIKIYNENQIGKWNVQSVKIRLLTKDYLINRNHAKFERGKYASFISYVNCV